MTKISKKLNNKLGPLFFKVAQYCDQVYWLRSEDFQQQLFVNAAFEKVWGRSCQDLYEEPALWVQTVIAEDRDKVRQHFMECSTSVSDQVYQIDFRIRQASGKIIYLRDTCIPILDGGKCIAFFGITTVLKQTNVAEEYASQFFRYFIEKSDSVFWAYNVSNKKQVYINAAYEKIWGKTQASLIKNPLSWFDAVLPEDQSTVKLLENEPVVSPVINRFRIKRPDGEIRWVKSKSFSLNANNGDLIGYAGISEDITTDVLRENELRLAKETAEKANESKSDFLAMMSHELRTPLNAILGMAQILRQTRLTRTQEGHVDVIAQSGQNLLALLNDILDFTKLEVGKLTFTRENINLYVLVKLLMDDATALAKPKQLALSFHIDKDVPKAIMGDSKRLRQILNNLLANAIKYTTKGFVKLRITCLQKNNKETVLCFTIEDSGIGIDKTQIESIFNRFKQIESVYQRKQQGVGLGLAIVKELVNRMNGSMTVSSELGVGSQFSCILPFALQVKTQKIAEKTSEYQIIHKDKLEFNAKVLVVEDNKINQKISKTMLEKMGCKVDIAENAAQALDRDTKNYDIIFMDLGLPDMDGFEATQKIRSQEKPGKRIPIVAMTAHVFARDQEKCFDVGMDGVVAKPIMQEDLLAVIARWAA